MDFLLIFLFQFTGVGLHVAQKIIGLGDKYPLKKKKEIISAFWQEDWDTLLVSAFVLLLDLLSHFVICKYVAVIADHQYFELGSFAFALFLGYAGQRVIYSWLGSAEKYINKQIDKKLQ